MTNRHELARMWLSSELEQRQLRNCAFSMRAFAHFLDVRPGRLSELLSGKRKITAKMISSLSQKLNVPEELKKIYKIKDINLSGDFATLSSETFDVIADWYYFAILSLIELDDFRYNIPWMAKKLKLSESLVLFAVLKLQKLGLIKEENKNLVLTHKSFKTTQDIESNALKESHRQSLHQALEALETPVELRDITSITCAISTKKIPEAKEMIKQFRRSLCELLEANEKEEVYNLNIQLIPVTQVTNL